MYFYKSRVGTFWIKPDPDNLGRWILGIENEWLGSYHSAVAAADDVYVHVTGCYAWDSLDGQIDGPTGLSEWDILR